MEKSKVFVDAADASELASDTKGSAASSTHGPNSETWDKAAEKKLLRKIDLLILPVMFLFYMLSYLDRINIGNARIQGMSKELKLDVDGRFNNALLVSSRL